MKDRTPIDYFVARTLLKFGKISKTELAAMERHWPDKDWDHRRSQILTNAGILNYLPNYNKTNDEKYAHKPTDQTDQTIAKINATIAKLKQTPTNDNQP